ncbi:Flp pilus assembly protein CpaB [Sedimentitalea sp.]|uniref:Flp pilus assembly protein CpaB n=1 Tax=Sedimentitalea sp. TaxID=2048915 RepID=UPI0032997E72
MRAIFGLVLIVGIVLAGGAVIMAKNYITAHQVELQRERQARAAERLEREAAVPLTDVYVAERSLKYGDVLTQDDVRKVRWPEDAIPDGAFTDIAKLFPPEESDDRVVLRAMEKDEAVLSLKVTAPGEDAGLTSQLARGMRAFAIRVDVASGVSGFLRPGDQVDVYWTGSVNESIEGARGDVTRLIETNVPLIAVDQIAGSDLDGAIIARTVTVAASPEQVAALAQAQSTGILSLALVGPRDDTVAEPVEVNQRSLLGRSAIEPPTPQVKKKVCTIRTRRGAEVVDIPIPCTN